MNLLPEREVTYAVPDGVLASVRQAFAHPPRSLDVSSSKVRLQTQRNRSALYLYLANQEHWATDRLIFSLKGGNRLAAEFSFKRWLVGLDGYTKWEENRSTTMDECAAYLGEGGRAIISCLMKQKWTLIFGKPAAAKVRLDCLVPLDPGRG